MKRNQQPQRIETPAGTADALGNSELLRNSLALMCSQKCPGNVLLNTYDFARVVRASGRAIVSGFHSPIENDCLPILLRGAGPIIIVQGHTLSTTRLPCEWQNAINEGRMLLLSPFTEGQKRVTAELAAKRNRFVAEIADEILIAYAHPGSKTEALCREVLASGKRVYTFNDPANERLIALGAVAIEPDHFSAGRTAARR